MCDEEEAGASAGQDGSEPAASSQAARSRGGEGAGSSSPAVSHPALLKVGNLAEQPC